MTYGSLFSGIGGIDLGLDRAGWTCRWQCEINEYCRRVLRKHWPNVPKYCDIRTLSGADLEPVDLLCGGFPCQDISDAGKRAGITGARSGLWREMVRAVRVVRPKYVLVENVAALLDRGMGRVLGDMADGGYDAEWDSLSACQFGAPHPRDRVFIVAYSAGERGMQCRRLEQPKGRDSQRDVCFWSCESEPVRVADGIPNRMERKHALGNAVVPQVAQWIGECITSCEDCEKEH